MVSDWQRAQPGYREINVISPSIGLEVYIMPRKQKRAGSVTSMVSSIGFLIVNELMIRHRTWYPGATEVSE
jgi:hypothetical protein